MPGLTHLFPLPETLAEADLESVGISEQQARTVRAVAKAVLAGTLSFDSVRGVQEAAVQFQTLPGLEEDTAAYIAMRALGDPDAFSCASVALRRAVASHRNPIAPEEVLRIFEVYRPWRAYAAMHYWTSMRQTDERIGPPGAARNRNARSIRRRSTAFRRPPLRP